MTTPPPVLIEHWLPIEAIGAESKRERGASSALPPLYFLHVWWARRPLTTSRAAILASVLPQWSPDFPEALRAKFPNEDSYRAWFTQLVGIRGDPVKGRKLVDWAKAKGIKLDYHPYGGAPRAFTVNPSPEDLQTMGDLLEWTWGTRELSVLDPFAGGGSIPFEALRYGFTTIANDLNPVASVIQKATLDYPARFGTSLADDIRKWGNEWAKRVKEKLDPYFPKQPGESIFAYLWARTVACPSTGKPVPLSPNWWLSTGSNPVAVKMIADEGMSVPRFEIVNLTPHPSPRRRGAGERFNPDEGTIARGVARSPWTGQTIDGDYIKAEAQAGRMGQILYAIATKKPGGFEFRAPTQADLDAVALAEKELAKKKPGWIAKNLTPTETIPSGLKTSEPLRYGMKNWEDIFAPRQLLALGIFLETWRELQNEIISASGDIKGKAIIALLSFALDKSADRNSYQTRWVSQRSVIANTFDRHDFAMKWSFAEFDAAGNLLPWAASQIVDAYKGICQLIASTQISLDAPSQNKRADNVSVIRASATDLASLASDSVYNITVDPPYYDNVMYAELSDFFYVWLKRSVGHLFPEFFRDELTNKDDEAVANPARFNLTPHPSPTRRGEGGEVGARRTGQARKLAEQDYERKMFAAFREMHRVLHPNGTLTVMFTHKKVEAWDTLASALIGAGFVIRASWPIHTEFEHSLHQARQNAAASTILLVCRKRAEGERGRQGEGETVAHSPTHPLTHSPVWWDDLQSQVRETARAKAAEFAQAGISGVDLYISTFGPTLSIISENWPVLTSEVDPKTGEPKPLRPETALDLAREEVVRLRKQGLLAGRDIKFDAVTDWYLMAWDAFHAEQFPYDEARKLAIALNIDVEKTLMQTKRLVEKKGEYVILKTPTARRRKAVVDDEAQSFEHWIDAAHTAMMVYAEDGAGACDVFLRKSGLKNDATFKALLQALLNAIPRARIKGKFVRDEADTLESLRLAFFDDLTAPAEEEPEMPVVKQGAMFEEEEGEEEEGEDE
ncbi:MAG: DUF1156 domain-containing protein [Chloroflexi bacterium]|nr:DUF1156 domain-containing protein [Chloroflexota bacterium]